MLLAVLQIHDILGWIRIRIRGSMPLTNGSGSCYFRHWPSRWQQKTNFLTQFFLLITFWSYIYIIFQGLKVKKSHKIEGIKVFLTIFAWWKKEQHWLLEQMVSPQLVCRYMTVPWGIAWVLTSWVACAPSKKTPPFLALNAETSFFQRARTVK